MSADQTNPAPTSSAEALRDAISGGPAALRRHQARELRARAAQMVRDAEAMETEASALEMAHG